MGTFIKIAQQYQNATFNNVQTNEVVGEVEHAISASYALKASTADLAQNAITASYVLGGTNTIIIQDEGSSETQANTINFTGAGVTTNVAGGIATVNIPGGGGGGNSFPYTGSAIISGSLIVTGSTTSTLGFTGSLFGTSSQALTASFAQTSISSSRPIAVTGSTIYSTAPFTGLGFNTTNSIFLGTGSGLNAAGAYSSNFLGNQAGLGATNSFNSNFLGTSTGYQATSAQFSNFIGFQAGYQATNAANSNFIGYNVGVNATSANNSNFIGKEAGYQATVAFYSNFLGRNTGFQATNAYGSNFLGVNAGYQSTNAFDSNFLGDSAGDRATNANNSNFIGAVAGQRATDAENSNFIGFSAGIQSTGSSFSTFLGHRVGTIYDFTNKVVTGYLGRNNIIIGTNISLPNGRQDSINLGAILFATGAYSDTSTDFAFTGSVGDGRVGINVVNPQYALDVSGSINFTGNLYQNGSPYGGGGGTSIFMRNKTNANSTDTITINQSIFNPSNLVVLSSSIFIIEEEAEYYVLGDLINSGSIIVSGSLKIGGVLYNSGSITGPGIIE